MTNQYTDVLFLGLLQFEDAHCIEVLDAEAVPHPDKPSRFLDLEYLANKYTYLLVLDQEDSLMTGLRKSASGAALGLLFLAACGGGTSSRAPGASPDQATSSLAITRSSGGVSPKANSVSGNGSDIIVHSDSALHQLASNPDSQQIDCPELNSAMLAPEDQLQAVIANRNRTAAVIGILILLTRASDERLR